MVFLKMHKNNRKLMLSASRFLSLQKRYKSLVPVIGLEIHMQILSNSKLFSSAPSSFGGGPNTKVNLFDAAIPGTLPRLNKKCVEAAVQTALALNCTLNEISYFDRKHYFYADMPAGYQITQQRQPIAVNGRLDFMILRPGSHEPIKKSSKIQQIQIEQDSGKSMHDEERSLSLIDLNRAGVGLLELVFEPDLSSAEEASYLVKELLGVLRQLKVCNCKMEEGALRVDANVSVHEPGTPLGSRTEIKNLNSVRSVRRAIDYEIHRQQKLLSNGQRVTNQTMTFDSIKGVTIPMRDKEVVQDYRFLPEPNIPPLRLSDGQIDVQRIKDGIPELPTDLRVRLSKEHNLPLWKAVILVNEPGFYDFFTGAMTVAKKPEVTLNLLLITMLKMMNERDIDDIFSLGISPMQLGELSRAITDRLVYSAKAEDIIKLIVSDQNYRNISVEKIVQDQGWQLIEDEAVINSIIEETLRMFPKEYAQVKKGKDKALQKMMDHVVKRTKGCADLKVIKQKLSDRIKSS